MPTGRRGLVAPQNTFLENIIRRSNSLRRIVHFRAQCKIFVMKCLKLRRRLVTRESKASIN
ncbi:unnamed protein product, partial [Darwinula stevensoni]